MNVSFLQKVYTEIWYYKLFMTCLPRGFMRYPSRKVFYYSMFLVPTQGTLYQNQWSTRLIFQFSRIFFLIVCFIECNFLFFFLKCIFILKIIFLRPYIFGDAVYRNFLRNGRERSSWKETV